MTSFKIINSIIKKEIRHQFKSPLIYIFLVLSTILVFFECSFGFTNETYFTKEKYEKKIGYIPYDKFQNMSENEFYMKYTNYSKKRYVEKNKSELSMLVYEDKMSCSEREQLYNAEEQDKNSFDSLLEKYSNSNIIVNKRVLNYFQLKQLSKQDYNKICHSLYANKLGHPNYFSRTACCPTYTQAKSLMKTESYSSIFCREYYFRLVGNFSMLSLFIIISCFIKDYKNNTFKNIASSSIKSYEYIMGKFLAINILTLFIIFVISMILGVLVSMNCKNSIWNFYFIDFIKYYILIPFISVSFINALGMFLIILLKDVIFSLGVLFFYISLNTQATKLGDYHIWSISAFRYIPRIEWKVGEINKYFNSIVVHQLMYFIITVIFVILTIIIWNTYRDNGRLGGTLWKH